MKRTGAQIVCESLQAEGVDIIFGILGGAILPLYQTLPQYPKLKHILVRHEQCAAHAADGYSRVTGKVGVCWATSGPGATNLVTGLANAMMDSVPMVAITGQVPRSAIGKDAFQETDVTGVTLPVTKHNYLVMDAKDLAHTIKEAFYIARSGRPGPVLIDIPKDVLQEEADYVYPESVTLPGYVPHLTGNPAQIKRAAKLIAEAHRPVIIAGHGVIISRAYAELKELAEKAQIPVITTLLGISGFPEDHVLSLGMPGMHGMAYANIAIDRSDLVIGIGMRFDDRVVGRVKDFAPRAKIIHIDIDPAEIDKNVKTTVPLVGDVKRVLSALNKQLAPQNRLDWVREVDQVKREHPSHLISDTNKVLPQYVVRQIWEATKGDAIIVTGVGQHQMWAAQHFFYTKPASFVTSGGLGTMGFEVPAAIGAKLGKPKETVWAICGDGGFQMTLQELATIAEHKIDIKFAIFNNGFHGMVRQWQELFYNKDYVATQFFNPDFVKLADAYGIAGFRVTDKAGVRATIDQAMAVRGPVLIDFVVEPEENVYPMIPAGTSVGEMIEAPLPGLHLVDSKDAST
ncbi:MAG: biosynthetic-type acetolactate synthase large subunit [Dehalococcoidia bacterium]|nr:biosynthetic-type acetolactate synthase large subunit [Dehalococcoidia bacterium]